MSTAPRQRRVALRSVKGQMAALAAVLVTIVLGASVVLIATLAQWNDASAQTRGISKARGDAALAVAAVLREQNAVAQFVVSGDPAQRDAVADARAAYDTSVAALRADLPAGVAGLAETDTFQAAVRTYRATVADPLVAAAAAGRTGEVRALAGSPAAARSAAAAQADARALWDRLDQAYRTSLADALHLRARLTGLIVAVLAVLLVAVTAAVVIVRRSVVAPLLALQGATRRVALGAWEDTVHVGGRGEVAALADDVDAMRRALLQALEGERRAAEALDQQGPAVLALRDALAARPLTQPGFECTGRLDPVEGLLAGDWYDVIDLGDHRVGLILGDVAGHGAASGVYALRLKGLLCQALRSGASPGAALATVAAHVTRFPDNDRVASGELFATVFVAVVDREVGELVYASAGHLEAVVMRAVVAGTDAPAGPELPTHVAGLWDHVDLPPTGPMLSTLLADRLWGERRHRFGPRDLLVAATDGVIEARDLWEAEYGVARIVDRLGARLVVGDTLDEAVDAVFSDLASFERRARDDRTMVALRQSSVRRRFGATRVSARPVRPA